MSPLPKLTINQKKRLDELASKKKNCWWNYTINGEFLPGYKAMCLEVADLAEIDGNQRLAFSTVVHDWLADAGTPDPW